MSESKTLTVRLNSELKDKLEALAKSTKRTKSWLAAEAIALYVEEHSWQIEQIEAVVRIADSPDAKWVSQEEVTTWLDSWGTDDEKSVPCK